MFKQVLPRFLDTWVPELELCRLRRNCEGNPGGCLLHQTVRAVRGRRGPVWALPSAGSRGWICRSHGGAAVGGGGWNTPFQFNGSHSLRPLARKITQLEMLE